MLMERELTINNSVCGRCFLSLIALLLMSVGMQAEDYGLIVGGVSVTDGNASNITGDNITAGTVSFSNGTLTLNNATISGSIEKSANEGGDQLIINLVGTNTVNGQILFQSPDLMYPGDLTFTGNGSLNIASDDGVFYGVSSVNTGEGLYIATDAPDPQCRNGYYFASNSGDTTIKNVTVSTSVTYPIWVYNTSTTHYTQLTAAAPSFTTPTANVDENHSGSVSFSDNTLTLTNFLCKTTENYEFVFFIGKSLDNLTVNLVGESSIYYSGFHYAEIEEAEDEPTLTYSTSNNGRLVYTGEPSYWSNYVTVNYENGLGYYSNVISTDWPRLQIGNTYVRGTTNTVGNYSNVSFDDATNTLTLGGVTIGTQGATVTDITVYIKDLNVEISGTNTVYGRFYGFYEEDYSRAGTITFKKKSGANIANLTVSGYGEGGPVTNFVSSTVEEGLSISGIDTDNEPVSSLNYQDGDYYDIDNPDNSIKEVLITSNEPFPLWINGIQVTSDIASNVLNDDLSEEGSVATVSYDVTTNTLTLNNAWISASNNEAIVSGLDNLTIFLVGENGIYGANGFTFNKTSAVEETTVTFTTDGESNGSLYINNLESKLFAEGVTPVYSNVFMKHDGDSHSIDCLLGVRVGGVEITPFNKDNVLGDGTVSYDDETHTLTLDNATIGNDGSDDEPMEACGIDYTGTADLTISLKGANTIYGMGGCETIRYNGGEQETLPKLTFARGDSHACSLQLEAEEGNSVIYGFGEVKGVNGIGEASGNNLTISPSNIQYYYNPGLYTISEQEQIQLQVPVSSATISADYVLIVAGVGVNASGNVFTEGANAGKVTFDADNNKLTLNGAVLNSGIEWNSSATLTIELNGENSITCSEETSAFKAVLEGVYPMLAFVMPESATSACLTLTVPNSMNTISGFNYPVSHEGMFIFNDENETVCTTLITSTIFSGGSGTSTDPFIIKTADDLKNFSEYIKVSIISNTSCAKLSDEISQDGLDCSSVTVDPIGYGNIFFTGTFDGNGKTIKNLTIADNAGDCVGFFRILGENGMVKDLTIDNFTLSGGNSSSNDIGGLVGFLNGGTISNCSIQNSTISCKKDLQNSYENSQNPTVGGIVGESNGTIVNCTLLNSTVKAQTNDTWSSGAYAQAGGIVGNAVGGTISGCQVKGTTIVLADYGEYMADVVAGVIVASIGSATLSNNTYEYTVTTSTNKYNGTTTELTTISGYEQRAVGRTYNSQTEQYEYNFDIFEDNGAVMYTQKVTLPEETEEASVVGEEGTYYSTVVEGDVPSILVAPGQTVTLNAMPGEGRAIASLTATNTTTSEAITTTATIIEGNETQYTFTMPDAPVNVFLTTAAAYGITVAGVAVTELNYSDVLGDHKVSFDVETSTLTLNGATINGNVYYSLEDELTVHLLGQNVIDGGWSEDADGLYAFVCESENASLAFTTDDENPGQLLMKNTYRNKWGYAQYYTDGFSWNKTYKNGLVEGYSSDEKHLIAVGPTITPGEGLYWTDQEYTITDGAQISCSDNQGHSVDVTVNANSFTLTGTGKYTISISKAVTLDDSNFSLSNSGCYIVHNKPTYSIPEGTYNDELAVKIENLPTLPENATYYPQVWYYLNDDEEHPVQLTSAEQTIAVTESTKVCVYFIDEDSGKVVKNAPVEAEYTIIAKTQLNISYAQNSRTWASYCATEKSLETPEGLQAYVVKQATKTGVQVEAIGYIPQGVGVLLKRTANISEPIMAKAYMKDETETYTSELVGTTASTPVKTLNGTVYVLYNDGFTRATSGSIGAHRGYLLFADVIADARLSIFEDETTAIKNVNSEATNNNYYNINGQRVATPKKNGLYIVDGQKRIVK